MSLVEVNAKDKSDVSMESQHSYGQIGKVLAGVGGQYFGKLVGKGVSGDGLHFLELLKPLAYVLDPRREESLTAICLSADGVKLWHKVPVDLILTTHSAEAIQERRYSELPELFRNLSAEPGRQEAAFRQGTVMLNSWELLCMVMMKHIAILPSVGSFHQLRLDPTSFLDKYDELLGSQKSSQRNDDSRLALVMFVKILEYCQARKLDADAGGAAGNERRLQAETFMLAVQEYFMLPIIRANSPRLEPGVGIGQRFGHRAGRPGSSETTTQQLEVLYVTMNNLQTVQQMFTSVQLPGRSFAQHSSRGLQQDGFGSQT
jgi:hypothetical protein